MVADKVPLGGLNVTPGRLFDADALQLTLPWEDDGIDTVTLQV